ncbi:hypothetical protein ACKKBG_A16470 [Auxenochlorella protothecoides x Auxenochlorella symbiontica]
MGRKHKQNARRFSKVSRFPIITLQEVLGASAAWGASPGTNSQLVLGGILRSLEVSDGAVASCSGRLPASGRP